MSMGLTSDEEDEESTPVINDITSPMEEGTPTAPLNITNNAANNMTGGIYSGLDPIKKPARITLQYTFGWKLGFFISKRRVCGGPCGCTVGRSLASE